VSAEIDRTLAALADPSRRAVVDLLRRQPLRSGDIADALRLSRPATSRHLRVLRQAKLVAERTLEDDARGRIYELVPGPFSRLRGWIEEVEAFWGVQLASFKAHAERGRKGKRS
jgi:DNA-binding transcriptional ArsR family regulator